MMKFTNFCKRRIDFKVKSALKGKNVTITGNLTKVRYALYKAAIVKFGRGNVWTSEDRIPTKVNGNFSITYSMSCLA